MSGRTVLVGGGARSGKSAYAERLAEVERLLVGQPELARQLVHPDTCCH